MAGKLTVLIGPNGYGKTTYLNEYKSKLINSGVPETDILFLESEIKLLDEVKDTVDTSQTMEYLLSELIETSEYLAKRDEMYLEADKAIAKSVGALNGIVDEVLGVNGSTRSKDFITPNPKKRAVKGLVAINQLDVKNKMGSGQRMRLLLMFARNSKKRHVILDEPEKYSHPSFLNGTAMAINELVSAGKDVIIATHSPKLVSMLELDYDSILIINDATHTAKPIPFDDAVANALRVYNTGMLPAANKRYYVSGASLKDCLSRRHGRAFIESLFTRRVYLCEGANDELFVNECLRQLGGFYGDYCVVKAWSKFNLPAFIALYQQLGIEIAVLFDVDNEQKLEHKTANGAIRTLAGSSVRLIEFNPCLEKEIGYSGDKPDAMRFMDHVEGIALSAKYKLV